MFGVMDEDVWGPVLTGVDGWVKALVEQFINGDVRYNSIKCRAKINTLPVFQGTERCINGVISGLFSSVDFDSICGIYSQRSKMMTP